jgi:hypothetical protein
MKTDKNKTFRSAVSHERGYVLLGILALTGITMMVASSMLQSSASSSKVRYVVRKDAENFYNVESSINKVTAWLQSNSKNVVSGFTENGFNSYFTVDSSPTGGSNQGTAFVVPTMIKMSGSNNAVQLTNNEFFGTSAFPNTSHINSGAAFDAVQSFESTDFGNNVSVRLLLIAAQETDGNFQPVFRIDAVTGADPERGVHGINFVKSSLATTNIGAGYYAENANFDTSNPNNQCWSYQYTWNEQTETWSRGAPRTNCDISARSQVTLKSAIHGNVASSLDVSLQNAGAVSGNLCSGADCNISYSLPIEPDWESRCGGEAQVNITATSNNQELSSGSTLATQCFHNLHVNSNRSFRFTTPDTPYYIKNLTLQNQSNSRLFFDTIPPGQKYILYIDNLNNGQINGNQLVGQNLAPHQLEIYITAPGSLTLNGTAALNGVITGNPAHTMNLLGNFSFYGALRSNHINVTGNAVLGYDEALSEGAPQLDDLKFTLYKASQRYR